MSFFSNLFSSKKEQPSENNISQEEQLIAQCPYCEYKISPIPIRKKKCPNCGEYIVIRTHYESEKRMLLTEAQSLQFDIEREKYYTVTSFLRGLKQFGIPSNVIDSLVSKQTKDLQKKINEKPSFSDVAWGVSNQLIIKYPNLSSGIHFQQALFMHREGKDSRHIRLIGFREDLRRYADSDVIDKVEVLTAGEQSCDGCNKLANKIFTIKDALENGILPCKECSYDVNQKGIGWCRCCYAPHIY